MSKHNFNGHQPKHKGEIEEVFCNSGCLLVDKILVPYPDCKTHGGAQFHNNKVLFTRRRDVLQ